MGKLENIVDESGESSDKPNIYERGKSAISNYLVDFSAGTLFYTPIMAAGEYFIADMESEEVLTSRIATIGLHSICFRPIGMLRNAAANYFGLSKSSRAYKKWASDVASTLSIQIPTYSLALYSAGVSMEEGLTAVAIGGTVTAVSGRVFGKWMDYWRGLWGKKKAIK